MDTRTNLAHGLPHAIVRWFVDEKLRFAMCHFVHHFAENSIKVSKRRTLRNRGFTKTLVLVRFIGLNFEVFIVS